MLAEAVGAEQRLLRQRVEQFRFDNSVSVSDRSYLRAGRRSLRDTRTEAAPCLKAGTILDDDEGPTQHNHLDDRCARESHLSSRDRDLHIRRDRHAVVQQRLHPGQVLPGSGPPLELQRFLPLVHDDLPHTLRRVDRAAVGLHASGTGRRAGYLLRHLPARSRHGELHGVEPLSRVAAQQLQLGRAEAEEGRSGRGLEARKVVRPHPIDHQEEQVLEGDPRREARKGPSVREDSAKGDGRIGQRDQVRDTRDRIEPAEGQCL